MTRRFVLFHAVILGAVGSLACSAHVYGRAYSPQPPPPPAMYVRVNADRPDLVRHHEARERREAAVYRAAPDRSGPNRAVTAPSPTPRHGQVQREIEKRNRQQQIRAERASAETRRAEAARRPLVSRQAQERNRRHQLQAQRPSRQAPRDEARAPRAQQKAKPRATQARQQQREQRHDVRAEARRQRVAAGERRRHEVRALGRSTDRMARGENRDDPGRH
jgi:hypothetical protein